MEFLCERFLFTLVLDTVWLILTFSDDRNITQITATTICIHLTTKAIHLKTKRNGPVLFTYLDRFFMNVGVSVKVDLAISWESSKWVETQPKVLWLPVQYLGLFFQCTCRWVYTTNATHKTFKSSNWHVKFWKTCGWFRDLGENNFCKYYSLTWNVKPCNTKHVSIFFRAGFCTFVF